MPGSLPPLPPELAHLTPDQQKMIFGRAVGTGEWVTPTIEQYNKVVGNLQGYVDERPQSGTFIGGMQGVIQHPTYTPPVTQQPAPASQQQSTVNRLDFVTPPPSAGVAPNAPVTSPVPAQYQKPTFQGQAPATGQAPQPYQRPAFQGQAPTTGQAPQPYQRPAFQPTQAEQFQGTMPAPQMMSLEEMMDVVGRRADLAYDTPIAAKERAMEEELLRGEQQKGEIRDVYGKALEDLRKAGQGYQRDAANTMRTRHIYDSGLAVDTSNRIYMTMLKNNMEISSAEAKELANLAEYLDLRQRHTGEEIQQMMGEKALFAQTLLDEMHQRNQDRRDMLAQQEFENWLAQQHYQMSHEAAQRQEYWTQVGFDAQQVQQEYDRYWNDKMFEWQQYETQLNDYWNQVGFDAQQAQQEYARFWDQANFEWQQYENQLNEYWRQTGFDAQQAQQDYQRYWDQANFEWQQHLADLDQYRWGAEFDASQHEAAWNRINSMNRWEAEMELAKLQYNNQLSQQEFQNMMTLNDNDLKVALYKAQYGG